MQPIFKTSLFWLLVIVGAVLFLTAHLTPTGIAIGIAGLAIFASGLVPILQQRKAERRANDHKTEPK